MTKLTRAMHEMNNIIMDYWYPAPMSQAQVHSPNGLLIPACHSN